MMLKSSLVAVSIAMMATLVVAAPQALDVAFGLVHIKNYKDKCMWAKSATDISFRSCDEEDRFRTQSHWEREFVDGYVRIRNIAFDKCVEQVHEDDKDRIELRDCSKDPAQLWQIDETHDPERKSYVSRASIDAGESPSDCISSDSNIFRMGKTISETCNGDEKRQRLRVHSVPN